LFLFKENISQLFIQKQLTTLDFLYAFLRRLDLFVIGFSIIIGIFAGWILSELLTQKYENTKTKQLTIIYYRLGVAFFGGLWFSIITYCLLDILP
jgi:hypothetical protein